MCNRYETPDQLELEALWSIGARDPLLWPKMVFPRAPGPFLRRSRQAAGYERELVVGQWGLIPWFAKEPKLAYSTNNARSEELAIKASYNQPWARGQRCIIPAATFDEPNWESRKNEWWRFARADGALWGLAGLWNTWVDKVSGEVHESYTMLTLKANDHPLMSRMHKDEVDPVTKKPLPLSQQDKRSVIPIELADVDQWLEGTVDQARQLLRLAPVELFLAGPADRPPPASLV